MIDLWIDRPIAVCGGGGLSVYVIDLWIDRLIAMCLSVFECICD